MSAACSPVSLPRRVSCLAPLAIAVVLALGGSPRRAAAIDIDYSYDHEDSPSFDPNGDKLNTIFAWAEYYYESILKDADPDDSEEFSFEIWWEDLDDSHGTLAETRINPFEIDIVFDTQLNGVARNWFIDETPLDNSEFTFDERLGTSGVGSGIGQTLFRDLSPDQQTEWFGGHPNPVLEVGYQASARSGGPAVGKFDLWSTLVHEMGHLLGIHSEIIDDDNDYEFVNSQHGNVYAALLEDADSDGHVAARTALMCEACGTESLRRLPSAADILSLSYQIGGVIPDIPRVDFIGAAGSDWNTPLNWIGGRVPDTFNEVFVRNGGQAMINDGASFARNMFVADGSSLAIRNSGQLRVFHELRVGNPANNTRGEVHLGSITGVPWLDVEDLNIRNGLVNLNAQNAVLLIRRTGQIDPQTALMGAGTVEVSGSLNNDGEISAGMFLLFGFGGELILSGINGGQLDLDGGRELVLDPNTAAFAFPNQFNDEFGRISAVNGNLRVVSRIADAFNGAATIGAGRTMTFMQPWVFSGSLSLQGGNTAATAATLSGAEINFGGTTAVQGVGTITAPVVTGQFTRITVRSGSRLNLQTSRMGAVGGPTVYAGSMTLETNATLNVDVAGVSSYALARGMTLGHGGTILGDSIVNQGAIRGTADFQIARLDNLGTIAPGAAGLGQIAVPAGTFAQSAAGRLELDLAGMTPLIGFDVVRAGAAQLGGVLSINLMDHFAPVVGSQFDILTAATITGVFSSLELHSAAGLDYSGALLYSADRVTFRITKMVASADFDGNGVVDGRDLASWQAAMTRDRFTRTLANGDADGDGDADGEDFLKWQRALGRGLAKTDDPVVRRTLAEANVIRSVPEPGTAVLALAVLGLSAARMRRSR